MRLPGYLGRQAQLREKGVSDVFVLTSGNAPEVVAAWGRMMGAEGSMVTFLSDSGSMRLSKALGAVLDHPWILLMLGSPRMQMFSSVVQDGEVQSVAFASTKEDPVGISNCSVTYVENVLASL